MKFLVYLLPTLLIPQLSAASPQCVKKISEIASIHVDAESFEAKHSHRDLLTLFGIDDPAEIKIDNITQISTKDILYKVRELKPKEFKDAMNDLIDMYADFAKEKGATPLSEDMSVMLKTNLGFDINFEKLIGPERMFNTKYELYIAALKKHKSIKNAVYSELSSPKKRKLMEQSIKRSKGVIVTAAKNGAFANKKAIGALLKFAEKNDAALIIQVVNLETFALDPFLLKLEEENPRVFVSIDGVRLNEFWNVNSIKIMDKQINTLMGLDRLWDRGTSQIIASSKFIQKSVPTKDNSIFPHYLFTTGAITDPNNSGKKYVQQRTDRIADKDHVIGALYLEKTQYAQSSYGLDIIGNFHARHLEFLHDAEGFVDNGILYTGQGTRKVDVDAVVLGDLHVGSTNQWLLETVKPIIEEFKPKYVVLHDAWDGIPVNHHLKGRSVSLAKLAQEGKLDLEKSLGEMINYINSILELDSSVKVVIDRSNHPDWLQKWIEADDYMKYPHTAAIHKELSLAAMRGEDPFIYALLNGVNGGPKVNKYKRVIFPQNSFKVGPDHRQVEIAEHGDKGANGAKGSINSFEQGNTRAVYGHTHKNERKKFVVNIGTFTPKEMEYNKGGFSNWSNSLAVVSEYGDIQVMTFDRGEWRAPKKYKPTPKFFTEGFPQVIPTVKPPSVDGNAGQIDQYN